MQDFETRWAAHTFTGWEDYTPPSTDADPLDLAQYSSVQALEALGAERIKSGLKALGLKCGGTVTERAERLFSTKGKSLDQLDKALFAKKKKAQV
jgi:splicing factor 3A subunit 3